MNNLNIILLSLLLFNSIRQGGGGEDISIYVRNTVFNGIIVKTAQIRNDPGQNGPNPKRPSPKRPNFFGQNGPTFFLSEMGLICEFEVFIFQRPSNPLPPPPPLPKRGGVSHYIQNANNPVPA